MYVVDTTKPKANSNKSAYEMEEQYVWPLPAYLDFVTCEKKIHTNQEYQIMHATQRRKLGTCCQ